MPTIYQYVVALLMQKDLGASIAQRLMLYSVKAKDREAAVEMAVPLAKAELVAQGQPGYEMALSNVAGLGQAPV